MRCLPAASLGPLAFILLGNCAWCQQSVNYPDVLKSTRYSGIAFEGEAEPLDHCSDFWWV